MAKGKRQAELHRISQGKLRIMESINRKLYRVEIWALNDKVNRNGWRYINLKEHLKEFQDIPILTAYTLGGNKIGDGHNFDLKKDPKTGEEYASFTAADAERIVGWVPKDADIRLEEEDGTTWIVVTGYLWTWYARELVEKIARQGSGMEISIETLITKEHEEGNTEVEEEYIVLGITVLGDGVTPAVAGANIQTLAALRDGMSEAVLKAASYAEESGDKLKGVKGKMNFSIKEMNELSKSFPEGYTCVGCSEDGQNIALLSADFKPFGYKRCESDKGNIVVERIKAASTDFSFKTDDGEFAAGFENIIECARANASELKAENDRLTEENKNLNEIVSKMTEKEKARRLQAAKDAVHDELERRNASRPEDRQFSEEICKDLMARIDANEFTDMEKDGEWTGEKAVCNAVAALCMDEQTRMDKEDKAKEKRYMNWNANTDDNGTKPHTIGQLFQEGK